MSSLVAAAISGLGGLDILVNSAGIGQGRPIEDCDEAMWDAHTDVNLKGLFFCCRSALSELRKSTGNIVNIASDAGTDGLPGAHRVLWDKGRGRQHEPRHGDRDRSSTRQLAYARVMSIRT